MASLIFKAVLKVFIFASISLGANEHSSYHQLKKIPDEDKKILEEFFRGMLSQGDFAAVLLCEKPTSVHDCVWWLTKSKNQRIKNFPFLIYNGAQVWGKYLHLFPNSRLAFFRGSYKKEGTFANWFAKRDCCGQIEEFLGSSLQGIQKDQELGLLLGYPKEDVEGFCLEKKILYTLNFFPYEIDSDQIFSEDLGEKALLSNPKLDPLTQLELHRKEFRFRRIYEEKNPFFPTAVYGYCSYAKGEENLEEWKEQIINLYNSENFLEEFLTLIIEE